MIFPLQEKSQGQSQRNFLRAQAIFHYGMSLLESQFIHTYVTDKVKY